jgi:NADPH-dependent 2,4-dienoyl-CoA reductase/sulfur reductase-like enzyme
MIEREVVIVGGGPAGLAAAIEAAKAGAQTLLVDENKRPGGQLFKQIHKFFGSKAHNAGIRGVDIGKRLLADTEESGVEVWLDSAGIGLFPERRLAVLRGGTTEVVKAGKLLVSTGASENAVSFDGWDLPGVMGAGAAQTMINVNRVLPGQRVLMVGSGNVGVIVAYQLMQAGADVVGIVEGLPRIGAYGVHAGKVRRAGVPFFLEHTVIRAEGKDRVEKAVIAKLDNWKPVPGSEQEVYVDVVCIAAGLRPMTELAWMAGVEHIFVPELGGWMPRHDENMESSVPGVYVAGDTAGVEEANTAMDEGRLAGVMMARSLGYLTDAEAKTRAGEIRDRLNALRQGPFGERRLSAKKRVMERGKA